jgi:predicted AAA+ superfamily ATPase
MEDPHGFLRPHADGMILDEPQNFPDIFPYVQVYTDKRNKPGQYLISGSQNFLLNEKISQTLAGRVGILELLPFNYNEIFYFGSLSEIIFKGGYPRLYNNDISPADFFSSYIQTYVERDLRQIKNISNLNQFQKFLQLCAGRVGQKVNYSSLGNDCGLSTPTTKEWLSILETSYVIYTLPPYSININTRMCKMPKLYFHDTGLLCNLLRINSVGDLSDHYAYGSIFENFVINEFLKTQCNNGERKNLYFLRDSKGREIDCYIPGLEKNLLYEIKSSATFNGDFVKSILYYKDKIPKSEGVLIYNGDSSFEFKGIKVYSAESMEPIDSSLMIFEKIVNDLKVGKVQSIDKSYVEQEVSKSTGTARIKIDVINLVYKRIQNRRIIICQKSGWWSDVNDEGMEEKLKKHYQNKDRIDLDELCDIINYIPVSNIPEEDRTFMRKVLSSWDATKECLSKLINEGKILNDGEAIFMRSLVQKDVPGELFRYRCLHTQFMRFLSKKYG